MKDERTEEFLREWDMTFHYEPRVELKEIRERTTSQGRYKLDDEHVQRLGALCKDGTEFPAVILFDFGKAPYEIGHGLHRLGAAKIAGREAIDAYIVERPTEVQQRVIEVSDNGHHGLPMKRNERISAVLRLVLDDAAPMRTVDAAKLVGVSVDQASKAIKQEKDRRELRAVDIPDADIDAMGSGGASALASLHVPVQKAIYETARRAGALDSISSISKKVKKAKSDEEQIAIVEQEAQKLTPERKATSGGRVSLSPKIRQALSALSVLAEIDVATLAESVTQSAPELVEKFQSEGSGAVAKVSELLKAISEGSSASSQG